MIDALLAGAETEENVTVAETLSGAEGNEVSFEESGTDSSGGESVSMLAQLMAEMQEEASEVIEDNFEGVTLMSEESIDALLDAAKNTATDMDKEQVSYELPSSEEMAEIEALLGMSDSGEILDENEALLKMLEEASSITPEIEDVKAVDVAELDSILSLDKAESVVQEETEKTEKTEDTIETEKKPFKIKEFLGKIFSALVEEVPEEEVAEKNKIRLYDENKDILEQLEQEDSKKINAQEKKAKKEKKQQEKKAKKEEKVKIAQERKLKKTLNKKDKPVAVPGAHEKKLPKKKVAITFAFAFSILAAILIVVLLVPSVLSLERARSAYDKGEYLEAYKEYYGQKLSEEDEKKFQAATTVLRMNSNLDGYYNYIKLGNEIYALHSLLEGVHVRDDVFVKAQEFDVLTEVSSVYNEILNLLNLEYQLTEEEAMELVKEKSDVTYTKKLQALTNGEDAEVLEEVSDEMNQENLLPEEELFFDAN